MVGSSPTGEALPYTAQIPLQRLPGDAEGVTELLSTDVRHPRRCLELAREALDEGDEPFGSLLVSAAGVVPAEDPSARANPSWAALAAE